VTRSSARTSTGCSRSEAVSLAALALLLFLQSPSALSASQSPTQTPATGAITGVLTDAISGQPIGGAIVRLEERRSSQGARAWSHQQVTTPKGRFAFVDVPPAEIYVLTSTKPGYLEGGHMRSDPRLSSVPVSLKEGQWLRDVRLTMARPGSISGTVLDERGEAVVGAHVRVLAQVMVAGRAQWLTGVAAQTDDRGAYRLAGLGPGSYVVSVPSVQATLPTSASIRAPGAWAGQSRADLNAMSDASRAEKLLVDAGSGQPLVVGRYAVPPPPLPDGRRTVYPIVFHPNASSVTDAGVIELRVAEDRSSVDFQLQPAPTARISGIVQGPPEAVGNQLLRLIPVGLEELGQGSEAATTVSAPDGRFTFLDVPSGSYVLDMRHTLLELAYTTVEGASTFVPAPVPFPTRAAASGGVRAAPAGVQSASLRDWATENYWGQTRLEVAGRNLDDVVLALRRPVSLTGRMVWAPGSNVPTTTPRPVLEPADGRRSLGMPAVDGLPPTVSFTIDGMLAGEYVLRVGGGVRVESIAWNGLDYTDRPFDGSQGRDFKDVVVTLTTATSSISGVVRDGVTPLTSGAAVIAFPVEREAWSNYGFNPPRLTSVLTTSDGKYRIDGLPAGEYFLVAVSAAYERAWIDPAFLAERVTSASRVRIERADSVVANFNMVLSR
jgi:large repetitive protein